MPIPSCSFCGKAQAKVLHLTNPFSHRESGDLPRQEHLSLSETRGALPDQSAMRPAGA